MVVLFDIANNGVGRRVDPSETCGLGIREGHHAKVDQGKEGVITTHWSFYDPSCALLTEWRARGEVLVRMVTLGGALD